MNYKTDTCGSVPQPENVEALETSRGHSHSSWTAEHGQYRTPLRLLQHNGSLRSTVNIQTPESVNSPQCYEVTASCSSWIETPRPQQAQQASHQLQKDWHGTILSQNKCKNCEKSCSSAGLGKRETNMMCASISCALICACQYFADRVGVLNNLLISS